MEPKIHLNKLKFSKIMSLGPHAHLYDFKCYNAYKSSYIINLKMYISQLFLLFSIFAVITANLELCSKPTNVTKLCKLKIDYQTNKPPRPWPCIITPYIDLKNVMDVDHDKKSMTLYVNLITSWYDKALSLHGPAGKE